MGWGPRSAVYGKSRHTLWVDSRFPRDSSIEEKVTCDMTMQTIKSEGDFNVNLLN